MQLLDHAEIDAQLDWPSLIEELGASFVAARTVAPARQVLEMDLPEGEKALLIMPAWEGGRAIGVKVVPFPRQCNTRQGDNQRRHADVPRGRR